ncbi:MAG: FkbM family methyltransferase [Bacteroidota bacterium]
MNLTGYWISKKKHLFAGIDMCYDIDRVSQEPINVIFDVGANVGQSVFFFKEEYKNATIYSFEPVKSSFQKLKERTKSLKNIYLENIALGESIATHKIKLHGDDELLTSMNSLDPDLMNKASDAIEEEIEVSTIDHYVEEKRIKQIDLLKLDVEKWEIPVLNGAKESLRQGKIRFILSEVGFENTETRFTNFNELSVYLKSLSFSFVGLYEVCLYNGKAHFGNALFVYEPDKTP